MPKKRQSTGNKFNSKNKLKQVQFTAPKRTINERGPTWSAPSKFQQTITQMNPSIYIREPEYEGLTTDDDEEKESCIASPVTRKRRKITPPKTGPKSALCQTITQMDPFRALYHPEVGEENLDDLEDEHKENNVPSPVKRRKRKVSPERAPNGKFRKRRLKQEVSQIEHQLGRGTEYNERQQEKGGRPRQQKSVGEVLPPPVTPRSRRKKEIPSSQSPADTPLSTRSRRSFRAYSRSPLKERSTNAGLPKTSCREGARGRRKVEIADSLESREDESLVLMAASSSENASKFGKNFSQVPMDSTITRTATFDHISDRGQRHEIGRKDTDRDILEREIVDSDEEDHYDDPDASLARQATSHSKNTSLTQQRAPDNQRHRSRAAGPSSSSQSPQQSNLRNRYAIERSALTKHISPKPTLSPPSIPPFHRTDSEQASAQLLADLRGITEPTLETDSQFEAGWNTYHPPTNDNDSPPTLLSSPPPIASPSSASITIPTQLLPPRTTADYSTQPNTSTQPKLPVPPSQATTTDTTQPSPRRMPSSQFFPSHSPYKLPTSSKAATAFPSSPPPMPPPSSSLVADESTAADPGMMGWKWNGVRLTDSQLLPESLLNDSLIGPVGGFGLSQESLEEEV